MKTLLYCILAGSLMFASCNNSQESHSHDTEEHGHSHDSSSDHTHDAAGEQVPVQQEEFSVTDSTHSAADTTKKEGTHTHEDGRTHADHD